MEAAQLHVAGTPCNDFSSRGEMQGVNGPTFTHFLSWASMRLRLQEEAGCQENVDSFPTALLHQLIGHLYFVDTSTLTPLSFGFPVSRVRKYSVFRHRYKTRAWKSPYNIFTHMFKAQMWYGLYSPEVQEHLPGWHAFFCAPAEELWRELVWASNRPESHANGKEPAFETFEDFKTALTDDPNRVKDAFVASLTGMESSFLELYRSQEPNRAYSLNQDPSVTFTSSTWRHMHTLIRSANLVWSLGRK